MCDPDRKERDARRTNAIDLNRHRSAVKVTVQDRSRIRLHTATDRPMRWSSLAGQTVLHSVSLTVRWIPGSNARCVYRRAWRHHAVVCGSHRLLEYQCSKTTNRSRDMCRGQTFNTTGYGSDAPWTPWRRLLVHRDGPPRGVHFSRAGYRIRVESDGDEGPVHRRNGSASTSSAVSSPAAVTLVTELDTWDVDYVIVEPDRDMANDLYEDGYYVSTPTHSPSMDSNEPICHPLAHSSLTPPPGEHQHHPHRPRGRRVRSDYQRRQGARPREVSRPRRRRRRPVAAWTAR